MKLNGKNIITDKDVTITEGLYLGETLSEVLESQQEDIALLKSNVKWIYKYGGVGSGSGSGSGSGGSSNWTVFVSLGGKSFNQGDVLALTPGLSEYTLYVQVKGGSGDFMLNWSCAGQERYNILLSAENGWSYTKKFNLKNNGLVSIAVTDNIDTVSKEANYVVNPYSFTDIQLYRGSTNTDGSVNIGQIYGQSDVFFEDVDEGGLYAVCAYDVNVAADVKYSWFDSLSNNEITPKILEDNKGNLVFEIISPNQTLNKDNAGVYSINLTIDVKTVTGDSEVITRKKDYNLIPENVYIRLLPANDKESFYDNVLEEGDFYKYKANKTAAFIAKTYFGQDKKRPCSYVLTYKLLTDSSVFGQYTNDSKKEWQDAILSFVPTVEGWYELNFKVTVGGSTAVVTKYIYCKVVKSSYNWFYNNNGYLYSSGAQILSSKYFRINSDSSNLGWTSQKIMTLIDQPVSQSLNFEKESGAFVINVGVQYNSINDANIPILELFAAGFTEVPSITLYQNKINFANFFDENISREIFIRKSENYDYNENYNDETKELNSHLVTIVWSTVDINVSSKERTYQGCVYIDGILAAATTSVSTASATFEKVVFKPGNYNINLFEVTYFTSDVLHPFNDADAIYYFNTYLETVSGEPMDDSEFELLSLLYDTQVSGYNVAGRTVDLKNNLVAINSGLYNDFAYRSNIPTLVIETTKKVAGENEGRTDTLDWLNTSYEESDIGQVDWKVPVTLYWSKGKSYVEKVDIGEDFSGFTIKIQGSSTRGRKAKNLTLALNTDLEGFTPVFSPNYVKADSETFLPEQEFTLKADVVDSSHSNNTSIGYFVNKYNDFNYSIEQNSADGEIKKHVRKCLEGFPVLVFLNLLDSEGTDQCYYLGIYNFNLGRGSYFNLGYSDLKLLEDIPDAGNSFTFGLVASTSVNDRIAVAEIQNNRKYWDFSQYHESILFPLSEQENSDFMFGDIVSSAGDKGMVKGWIQQFVQQVAKAGGYIFEQLGKTLTPLGTDDGDNRYAYRTIGTVPSYRQQYIRTSGNNYKEGEFLNQADLSDLKMCVQGTEDGEILNYLNLDSASYYYTTCMVFALVDSVQKNLNVKSWNGHTFGLYFYDMDTSLGINNEGSEISYFCFSDFWKSNIEIIEDEYGDKTYLNKGVVVYRDYVEPNTPGWYDTPSSYIFAIPKYISVVAPDFATINTPQNIYITWRSKGGILESANKFIDEVFASTVMNAPRCLINLNYRNKYLYSTNANAMKDVGIFKGTRIEKTRDWLAGRLRILDGYFNLSGIATPIYIENEDYQSGNTGEYKPTHYFEPVPTISSIDNDDIYISRDIFIDGSGVVQMNGSFDFTINAEDYSPLLVLNGDQTVRYLLEDSTKNYTFRFESNGLANMRFGGSRLWRSIDSINSFVNAWPNSQPFYLNSNKLKTIYANNNRTFNNSWNLQLPSSESINLTGPNYSGALRIDSSFYNLSEINLSGSKISLTVENSPSVSTINLNRINSSTVSISDTTCIKNLSLTGSTIGNLWIKPYWEKNFTLASNTLVSDFIIFGKKDDNSGTLTVNNNTALTSLTFKDFSYININDCSKLKSLTCDDSEGILKTIKINNCPQLTSIEIPIDNTTSIDLKSCGSLETIILKGNSIEKFDKLTILNLSGTKVTSIIFRVNGNVDSETEHITEYLDLSKFPNLSKNNGYFDITNNSAVQNIQFLNDIDNPVLITRNFYNCVNLERVFGNLEISVKNCFANLPKFSIHGSTIESWKGYACSSGGVVKMPHQLLGKPKVDVTDHDLFSSGVKVTNIKILGDAGSFCFQHTNCTLFDYYYVFTRAQEITNAHGMFYGTRNETYGKFDWTSTVDNSPNKELFINCPKLTDLGSCFYACGKVFRIFSPTNDGISVIKDDGLFSPIIDSVTSINYIFSGDYYADRFVFRMSEDSNYTLTSIYAFSPKLILDDVNSASYSDITFNIDRNTDVDRCGNLDGFFINLQNVSEVTGFLKDTTFINYNTSCKFDQFKFPQTITKVNNVMNSKWGVGELILKNLFDQCSSISEILSSFRISSKSSDMYVTMILDNNTFSEFTSLAKLGYTPTIDGNYYGYTWKNSSFLGSGIEKIIKGSFPFSIFSNLSNLEIVTALFADVKCEGLEDPKLPGTLFIYNPKLTSCEAIFYNFGCPYTLSSAKFNGWTVVEEKNFVNCPNLTNVAYAFAQESGNKITPVLSGSIPIRFFFHGIALEKEVKIKGTNTRTEVYKNDLLTGYNYENVLEESIGVQIIPNNKIENMSYCFQHCNLSPSTEDWNSFIEMNPEYWPFQYVTEDGKTFKERQSKNSVKKLGYWCFSGDFENQVTNDTLQLETVNETNSGSVGPSLMGFQQATVYANSRYMCPPDTLRYCTNNCKIVGLFAHSGIERIHSGHNNYASEENWTKYGITGRICPYMLLPVSKVTDISYMFTGCKKLTAYSTDIHDVSYLIPKDFFTYAPEISNLQNTFAFMLFDKSVNLDVFESLKNPLNLTQTFFGSIFGGYTENTRMIIGNIFEKNKINSLSGVFANSLTGTTSASSVGSYEYGQYVTFDGVFKKTYSLGQYATSDNFKYAFSGYSQNTVRFENKTLSENADSFNYAVII